MQPDYGVFFNAFPSSVELHFPRSEGRSRPSPCALRRLQSSPRGRAAVIGRQQRVEDLCLAEEDPLVGAQ